MFEIRYDEEEFRRSPARWRFSIAHELGHTFFFDRSGERATRLPKRSSPAEERFCNVFAGDLLCPRAALGESLDPTSCWRIARLMSVSPQVVARQALRHERLQWRAFMGLAVRGKASDPSDEALRTVWVVTPDGTFVPIGDKFSSGPAVEALESGHTVSRLDRISTGSVRGVLEQMACPGPARTVILAVR
jgi:hypothetical protein